MEENTPKTGKYALKYGLMLGGISIAFVLMLFSLDMHYQGGAMVFLISVLLSLAFIIIGMLQFKKDNGGFISVGQALKVGVGISLIGGIIGVIFNQILAGVIDPDFMTKATEYQKGMLLESGLSMEQIEANIEMSKPFQTPVMQILFGLLYSIVAGFLLSLIPAFLIKKQETI
ncbi:DUF4199 domain-containing protein [Cellulophaga omnivescoria]|uniref:DUF4199 domain-containing protein n=1 Tax=Cellulophaga omnivescoria TaxID=1888890 RepID=UPI000986B070|nr:DUF4199 domain-containing protein [Cellulophaga omnivescoria]WBU88751.1 DUF4199 domain-containing protein [Cellulophaga omnivescoria]WKB80726.1 DUF4199 domain-containing protein [Cellulophaga lytica]